MRKLIVFVIIFLAIFPPLSIITVCSAAPQDDVQLNFYPNTLELAVGEAVEVVLTAHNYTEDTLIVSSLQSLPSRGITASIRSGSASSILPQSDLIWTILVTRTEENVSNQPLYFRLDYRNANASRSVFGSIVINLDQLLSADNVATLVVETADARLSQQRSGWVYLVITNNTNQPIQIQPIQMNGPGSVNLVPKFTGTQELAGLDTLILTVDVLISDVVQPGDHLLIFDVPITQERYGIVQTYHLVRKQTVTVDVFGASEILAAFQIPSILLLPGMLAVITIGLWWKLFKPTESQKEFPLTFKSESFWLVSISISILIAVLYPSFTEIVLKDRRDYLYGYGIIDIMWIWFLGVALGLIYSLVGAVGRMLWGKMLFPAENDSPVTLLRKLHRQGLKVGLHKVRLKDGDRELYLLQKWHGFNGNYWVSEHIGYSQTDNAIEQKIEKHLVINGNPGKLANLLDQGKVAINQRPQPEKIDGSKIDKLVDNGPFVFVRGN
ncbi:MAG: hypothetical protein ABIF04_04310 [Chloroflexota bacterium]